MILQLILLILSKKNILDCLYSVLFEVSTIIVITELLASLWGPVLQLLFKIF